MKVFCGIDWSERHHDVALVDQDGALIAKRRIGESMEDFAELLTLLAEAGDSAEEPIPVAIETSRGLLVAALRATGRPIYAIKADGSVALPGAALRVAQEIRPRRRDDPGEHPAHRRPRPPQAAGR